MHFDNIKITKINPNYVRLIGEGFTHKVVFKDYYGWRFRVAKDKLRELFGDAYYQIMWGGTRYGINTDGVWVMTPACDRSEHRSFEAFFRGLDELESVMVIEKLTGEES